MDAIVLAGGFGTRLAKVVKDVPKPMAPVAGKPFMQYILDDLISQGVDSIVIAVCHKKECIMNFFEDEYRGARIQYSIEEQPLFTGGAIKQALQFCTDDRVLVINGDTYFKTNLQAMRRFAKRTSSPAVIAVKHMEKFERYGSVAIDENDTITAFREKQYCESGFINGGIYDLKKDILRDYPQKFSLETECFPKLQQGGLIKAFVSDGLFIDIGIPEDYDLAQVIFSGDYESGVL